ncbi:MAG: hypothetical protein AAFO94_23120, partial [Bacteroidota bacterium]
EVKNLKELLKALRHESAAMFVNLCSRCGSENYLMDRVVSKLQAEYGEQLGYEKLPVDASKIIQQELMISKNPVLLLIKDGEIKAVFDGISAQFRLEAALRQLDESATES